MKKTRTEQRIGIAPEDRPESGDPEIRMKRALDILSPKPRCDDSVKADHEQRPRDSLSAPRIPSCICSPAKFDMPKEWGKKVTKVVWVEEKKEKTEVTDEIANPGKVQA